MSIKFLVLGGGIFGGGGGEVPILFLWARGFFWNRDPLRAMHPRRCEDAPPIRAAFLAKLCFWISVQLLERSANTTDLYDVHLPFIWNANSFAWHAFQWCVSGRRSLHFHTQITESQPQRFQIMVEEESRNFKSKKRQRNCKQIACKSVRIRAEMISENPVFNRCDFQSLAASGLSLPICASTVLQWLPNSDPHPPPPKFL